MIPTDLLKLIDKYNEKGIFINGTKWFNGKRYEMFFSSVGTNKRLIQIEIRNVLHSYVFSTKAMNHFNGKIWEILKICDLPLQRTKDYGKYYYFCEHNIRKYELVWQKASVYYCTMYYRGQYYLIDLSGNIYRIREKNFNITYLYFFSRSNCEIYDMPFSTFLL